MCSRGPAHIPGNCPPVDWTERDEQGAVTAHATSGPDVGHAGPTLTSEDLLEYERRNAATLREAWYEAASERDRLADEVCALRGQVRGVQEPPLALVAAMERAIVRALRDGTTEAARVALRVCGDFLSPAIADPTTEGSPGPSPGHAGESPQRETDRQAADYSAHPVTGSESSAAAPGESTAWPEREAEILRDFAQWLAGHCSLSREGMQEAARDALSRASKFRRLP